MTTRRAPAHTAPYWAWLLVCTALVAGMAVLRLNIYPDRLVTLAYSLPLLVCIWHRRRTLLYGMALAFSGIAAVKIFELHEHEYAEPGYLWTTFGMQLVNIWVAAAVVHLVITQRERLERKRAALERLNAALEASNAALAAREAEISRQNEELQAQGAELEQQTEELRQQAEELEQQHAELLAVNDELQRREAGTRTLLESARWLRTDLREADLMGAICQAAVQVLAPGVQAAAIVQEQAGRVRLRGHYGFGLHGTLQRDCDFSRTLGSLVMERGQTAYLQDVSTRPDLELPQPLVGPPFRSVLSTPIWTEGKVVGAVEAYATRPRDWSQEEFGVLEWLAAQAALAMQAADYQRELDLKRREAEEASRQKTRFLAAVSHDVRTPANAISLVAELIQRSVNNPRLQAQLPQLAADLKASAAVLIELVSDVLDLTQFDTGKLELYPTEFDLADCVQAEVRQFHAAAQAKGLQLCVAGLETPIRLCTDRMKLARILSNLIGNAVKFTDAGEVRVSCTRQPDGLVELAVSDTGVGIAPEHLANIFDEFFQLRNPARDRNQGSGLGLAICRRLVNALGCSIRVESTVGGGSTFRVRLPPELVRTGRSGTAEAPAAAPVVLPAEGALAGTRVLLVEDHTTTRSAAAQLLREQGAQVLEAPDARTAMQLLGQAAPEVLLLDLMLPDMDGTEVLRYLRQHPAASLRCVLVLSADAREARAADARRLGASEVLAKPLSLPAMLQAIQNHGQTPAGGDGDPVRRGHDTIAPSSAETARE